MALAHTAQIGTTQESLATLESLGGAEPEMLYFPEVERVMLTSRKPLAIGAPYAVWKFGFLRQETRDTLREFCSGTSATVFIETATNENEDEFAQFQATMIWPEGDEGKDTHRRIGFDLRFIDLVEVTPIEEP